MPSNAAGNRAGKLNLAAAVDRDDVASRECRGSVQLNGGEAWSGVPRRHWFKPQRSRPIAVDGGNAVDALPVHVVQPNEAADEGEQALAAECRRDPDPCGRNSHGVQSGQPRLNT